MIRVEFWIDGTWNTVTFSKENDLDYLGKKTIEAIENYKQTGKFPIFNEKEFS